MDLDFTGVLEAIQGIIEDVLTWIWEVVTYIPMAIYEWLIDSLVGVIEGISVPSWMQGVNIFSGISPGMSFFMQGFAIPEGLAILGGALVLRFLLRRIPLIG